MKKIVFFILPFIIFSAKAIAQDLTIDPSLTETPISAKTLSSTISGSLVMPKNVTDKIPVVIIIGDAGPTDRDGNNAKTGINGNTYKLLANELGKKGIATVRYDKRFVGASTTSIKESQLHIEDYSDDAVSLITLLDNDQRFSKVILFGHGEGALVAMLAGYDQSEKGFIIAEGLADRGEKILIDAMKEKPKFLADEFKAIMDSLKKGKTTDKVDPSLYYIARPSIQPFLMSFCRYDPIKSLKAIKVPILILQGTTDLTVPVTNGDRFKKAKSDAFYMQIKNMNHILKDAPADPDQNTATYDKPNLPVKPEMVNGIVEFINTKLK
jgi:pimeloyl-ACP methyl ester carboxylesterase